MAEGEGGVGGGARGRRTSDSPGCCWSSIIITIITIITIVTIIATTNYYYCLFY